MTKNEVISLYLLRFSYSFFWLLSLVILASAYLTLRILEWCIAKFSLSFDFVVFWSVWHLLVAGFTVIWIVAFAFAKVNGVHFLSSVLLTHQLKSRLSIGEAVTSLKRAISGSFAVDLGSELYLIVKVPNEVVVLKKLHSELDDLGNLLALGWGGSVSAWQTISLALGASVWVLRCQR